MNPTRARSFASLCLLVVCAAWTSGVARSEDWPQFRGPNRDGISSETGLAKAWPETGPEVLWRRDLGEGYSGISVTKGRIFTMYADGQDEHAVALDAASGKQIWSNRIGPKWLDRFGNGPRSTPTVDDEIVFVLGSKGHLVALSVNDGHRVWERDLGADFGAKPPQWGVSTSPLVEGDLLLVNVGGEGTSLVAFDKRSGKEAWRSQSGLAGYSAPLGFTAVGLRQVLFFNANGLVSVAPEDGRLIWQHSWTTDWDVNASTPIFAAPNKVFVSTGYGKGAALLALNKADGEVTVEELWRNREMQNKFSSSVLLDGYLYGFDEKILKCVDLEIGETKWRQRGFGYGSLIVADGHLIVLGDGGRLALVEATAAEYRERGRFQVFEGKSWTTPTLVDGRLFLRDEKEIVSLDISSKQMSE